MREFSKSAKSLWGLALHLSKHMYIADICRGANLVFLILGGK